MRPSYIPLAAVVFVLACADAPTAPVMQSGEASFGLAGSYPPPPWAEISGDGTTDGSGSLLSITPLMSSAGTGGASASHSATGVAFTYFGMFLVNKPGNIAWLRFTDGINVTFSPNARIMSHNGDVSGVGTMTVGGDTYQLSSVQVFEFNGNCTNSSSTDGPVSCASFLGDGFTSESSTWTGRMAGYQGGWNFDGPPGGGGGGGGDACIDPFCFDGPGGGGGEVCLSEACTDPPGVLRGKKP